MKIALLHLLREIGLSPDLAVTANAFDADRRECLAAGTDDLVAQASQRGGAACDLAEVAAGCDRHAAILIGLGCRSSS
jgi:CheY-like chemotaxis protein